MILLALLLFFLGLLLSGFFSGTETGMYRVSRVRIVLDALGGSWLSRVIFWMLNHPTVFVATALVGNNTANYLVSLSIVMLIPMLVHDRGVAAEMIGTVLVTPLVFVGGELLPKYLFFHAPYRLIRATRPLLIFFTVLFAPVSLLLGLLGNLLRLITGETPIRARLSMQRAELEQVLQQGHEAGVLAAGQRQLVRRIFDVGNCPAIRFGLPPGRVPLLSEPFSIDQAKRLMHRHGQSILLVQRRRRIVGYLRLVELVADQPVRIRKLVRCAPDEAYLAVMYKLHDAGCRVAVLVDTAGRLQGVVSYRQLQRSFLAAGPGDL